MHQFLECVASNVALSAALALITVGLTRVWRSPQLAHALWLLVLFKLISPPLVPVAISDAISLSDRVPPAAPANNPDEHRNPHFVDVPQDATAPLENPPALDERRYALATQASNDTPPATATPEPVPELPATRIQRITERLARSWPWSLCAVWAAGVVVGATSLVRRIGQFRALLAGAHDADVALVDEVRAFANLLGLRQCPTIRVVDAHLPPLVCAAWHRPLLVLPETLLRTLDREQIQAVLVHELAHIQRGDHLLRWFEIVVCGVFWWNPLAWWAARQLRQAEEECCDAWVVSTLPHARQSYGRALLRTMDFLLEPRAVPAVARTAFGGPHIKRRIEMIVKRELNQKMSTAALLLVIVSAVCVLPVSAQKRIDTVAAELEATEQLAAEKSAAEQEAIEAEKIEAELNVELAEAVQALTKKGELPAADRDLEARIDRLEQALQELIQTVKARPDEVDRGKPAHAGRLAARETERPQAAAKPAMPVKEATAPSSDDEFISIEVPYTTSRVVQEVHSRKVRVRKSDAQKDANARLKKHLLSLNDELWDAAEKRDPSVAERLQADDYIGMWVNASGSGTNDKAVDIAAVQRRKYSEVSRRAADVRRISDDVAILTYIYDCKVQEGDRIEIYREHQATQLWARTKDGRWLLRYTQDFIRPGGQ